RMLAGVREHEILHGELDVDHAAGIVLQIELRRRVRVAVPELAAHLDDVGPQRIAIAPQAHDRLALGLERGADRRVARDKARARQRLMLPRPGLFALIAPERGERGYRQAR